MCNPVVFTVTLYYTASGVLSPLLRQPADTNTSPEELSLGAAAALIACPNKERASEAPTGGDRVTYTAHMEPH